MKKKKTLRERLMKMNRNRFAAALLALVVLFSFAVPAWAEGEPFKLIAYDAPASVKNGDVFSVTLYYDGDATGSLSLEDDNFTMTDGEVSATDSGTVTNKLTNDDIDKTKAITIKVKADEATKTGTYTLNLSLLKSDGSKVEINGVKMKVAEKAISGDDTALVFITSYRRPTYVYQNETFDLALTFGFNSKIINSAEIIYLSLEDTNFTIVDQKGVPQENYSVSIDETHPTETLKLKVSPNVANGTYPLTFTAVVKYTSNGVTTRGVVNLTAINVNVNVPEESSSSSSSSESEVTPIMTPHLVITGFSTAGMDLENNENFTFSVSFENTSKAVAVQNVLITVTLPDGVSMPFASTNFYIDKVDAGKSQTLSFTLKAKKDMAVGVANLGLAFNYQYYFNKEYVSGTDSETVGLAFGGTASAKEDRFEISNIATPDTMMPGEEAYLTITVINKGKEQIMNVQAKIESTNLSNSGASEYYGMLDVNKKDDIELPMVAIQGGNVIGTVTITYELSDGTEKSIVKDFTAYAEEASEPTVDPGIVDPGMVEPEQPQGLAWWAWALIAAGGVVVLVVVIKLVKKHADKKKQAAIDAEDSEDE